MPEGTFSRPYSVLKPQRHAAILDIVRNHRVHSQEALRELLVKRGVDAAQATLSRDIRELGLVKVPDEEGGSYYTVPAHVIYPTPTLARLLPALYLGSDGVGNLLIVKTLTGGAQPIAVALDWEEWPEIVGTLAGDDTILVVIRNPDFLATVSQRLQKLAGL
ncbi:MAG TPA: arginine repressor [Longimicrobiaceae bacterium]|nr:arginine repressor [Longimicrobiaceae bacterium]